MAVEDPGTGETLAEVAREGIEEYLATRYLAVAAG
jgi:hypothetical protein